MFAAGTKAGTTPETDRLSRNVCLRWTDIIAPAEPFLELVGDRLTEQIEAFDPEIATYARYALTSQGKQLRPALVSLSAGSVGKIIDATVQVAVIIEMVHLATLVHDDVMDEAEIRRRKPTLAAHWGNELSVLLGDCLFAQAVKLAASFPTPDICRAVAAATNTVCSGEILQTLQSRNFNLTRSEYFKILRMKTAELFALSCDLGASLAGADTASRRALRDYGMTLGTAYQIYDDCLDLFGSEARVGKSLGTDLACGKITLPIIVLLERGSATDRAELRELIQQWNPRFLPRVLELLEKYDAQEESSAVIQKDLQTALDQLDTIEDSQYQRALSGITRYLAQQTHLLGRPS